MIFLFSMPVNGGIYTGVLSYVVLLYVLPTVNKAYFI
jgi:hypothetical protein